MENLHQKPGRGSFATDLLAEKHCKEELRDGPSEEGQGGEDSTPRGRPKSRSLGSFLVGKVPSCLSDDSIF